MELWHQTALGFFIYVVVVADLLPRLAGRRRRRAIAGSAIGAALVIAGSRIAPSHWLNVWVLPPVVLLIGYYASGLLFTEPMPRAEHALARLDAALRIDAIARRVPRALAELLEFSYAGVYPLMVIAETIALSYGVQPDRFWTVLMWTDFLCFAMLPWIRTRTPREVIPIEPWRSSWRALNLRIVGASSIGVNTFPSGHAAVPLAAALLLVGAPWPWVLLMFTATAAISAGAVFGRYHYAADAIAGWAVAAIVYVVL